MKIEKQPTTQLNEEQLQQLAEDGDMKELNAFVRADQLTLNLMKNQDGVDRTGKQSLMSIIATKLKSDVLLK